MTEKVVGIVAICSFMVWICVALTKVAIDVQYIRIKVDAMREDIDLLWRGMRSMEARLHPHQFDRNFTAEAQRQAEQQQRMLGEQLRQAMAPPRAVATGSREPEMWLNYGQVQRSITPDPEPGLAD